MDRSKYTYHVRDRLIENFRKEIDSMTDEEVLNFNRCCPFCQREFVGVRAQDAMIIEGMSSDDIDHMLDAHRDHDCPFFR